MDCFSLLLASEGARIPLAMLVVFGCAKLGAEVAERLNQPGIVGELLKILADLGVMFLLFRVGLEVKASELLRLGGRATLVASCGVVAPFLLGWGILSVWGHSSIEAIFVGASMVATSVGITASVLAAKGVLNERASQIILAAAVIDDVLGLIVLALVGSIARARINVLEITATAGLAAGFVVVAAKWGTTAAEATVRRLVERLRLGEAEFALAMVVLFACSLAAVYSGVAAIAGAFLAGIGLNVDLAAFRNPNTILLAGVIILAAVVSKFIGCAAASIGLGRTDGMRIGVGMIPRGEVGMLVAQIGLGMGAISRPVYGVVVSMAVATTLVAPPLLALVFRERESIPDPAACPDGVY
ncbi:MAG: cation:proton antiporter [Bryobacteraceae bacterium]|jgi:Kef-type K+ transport system membrane component KefB